MPYLEIEFRNSFELMSNLLRTDVKLYKYALAIVYSLGKLIPSINDLFFSWIPSIQTFWNSVKEKIPWSISSLFWKFLAKYLFILFLDSKYSSINKSNK